MQTRHLPQGICQALEAGPWEVGLCLWEVRPGAVGDQAGVQGRPTHQALLWVVAVLPPLPRLLLLRDCMAMHLKAASTLRLQTSSCAGLLCLGGTLVGFLPPLLLLHRCVGTASTPPHHASRIHTCSTRGGARIVGTQLPHSILAMPHSRVATHSCSTVLGN